MKTLYLLRHAKSDWDESGLSDAERPLAPRGRTAARRIGRHLRLSGGAPDLVLCSPARRAVETLDGVLAELESLPPVELRPALYLCGWTSLLGAIHALPSALDRVMLVSHNPDLHDLALALVGTGPSGLRETLAHKFPTGAMAVLRSSKPDWASLDARSATLEAFVRPRDLG